MKVINYIHIKNMIVHKDIRIDFEEGKNFIVGPIGSGKTLINECIAFGLFGSVALRGKTPTYKKSEVELSFNYNGETFVIKRKTTDATLLMLNKDTNEYIQIANSTTVVNQKLIALIGYNYDVYLLSNYCKQKKLSYFSELTPAKRLQYIDKISGIEESKEFGSYLMAKRKALKENILLLKDMVKEPELNKELDLSFDYNEAIKLMNIKLNNINVLYTKYDDLLSKSLLTVKEPKLILNASQSPLVEYSLDILPAVKDWFDELVNKESILSKLENELRELPSISNQYKDLKLEDVEHMIFIHNRNIVRTVSEDLHFNCNHCNNELDFKLIMDRTSINNEYTCWVPIKDLYNIKDYLIGNFDSIKADLNSQIKQLEKEYEEYISSSFIPDLINYRSYVKFESALNSTIQLVSDYNEELCLYTTLKDQCNEFAFQALACKVDIEEFLKEQSEMIALKDSYIRLNTEKNIYIERLGLYNTSKVKYDEFVNQFNILNGLLKKLDEITLKIKNDTIPLINYFASYYLNLITNGSMATIEITDDYDLIVDGTEIALKSGGQTDLASLAFRLSLSKSIITGMLPLFIGDEIDSAGSKEVSDDIMKALDTINNDFQIIIVTHKNTEDLTDCNIIQL